MTSYSETPNSYTLIITTVSKDDFYPRYWFELFKSLDEGMLGQTLIKVVTIMLVEFTCGYDPIKENYPKFAWVNSAF